jgi:hypothetical protein
MNNNISKFRFISFTILGLIFGGIFGESLGWLVRTLGELSGSGPDNSVSNFFVNSFEFGLGYNSESGLEVDLHLIRFKFGIGFKLNILSILGLIVAYYIEKWSRKR